MNIIHFHLCAIPIYIIILLTTFVRKTTKGAVNKLFISLVLVSLITTLVDLSEEMIIQGTHLTDKLILLCTVFSYIYFIMRNGTIVLYLFFIFAVTRTGYRMRPLKTKIMVLLPYAVLLLALFQNIFTHNVFIVSQEQGYQRKILIFVLYFISIMYALAGTSHLVRCRKFIDPGKWVSLLSMYILSFAAIFIQLIHPTVLIEMFSTAVAFLMVILLVLRPEEITDYSVGLPSFKAYQMELRKIIMTNQRVRIIVVRFINANDIRVYLGETLYNTYIICVSEQIDIFCRKARLTYEMYFEAPGTLYIVLENMKFDIVSALEEICDKVGSSAKEIEATGAKLVPRVCSIKYPEDVNGYNDIIHLGQEFHGLIPFDQMYTNASDIVGSKNFTIKSNIDGILNRAITENRLEMYYQPIYSVKDKKFISAEALIRLTDRKYGPISPGLFIPAAESRGLILPIGDFVLDSVFKFISEHDLSAMGLSYIEINLSVAQCLQQELPEKMEALREKYGVDPNNVNLEITETTYDNIGDVLDNNLKELVSEGYSFSLDDYGTGYSNMQRVSKLPLKIIKLDKTLVDNMDTDNGMVIMDSTIKMMKGISKELVAEGVEDKKQLDKLAELGCDFIQGFYFSRPLPARDFVEFLRINNRKEEN